MAVDPTRAGPRPTSVAAIGTTPGSDDVAAKALIDAARKNIGWHEGPNNENPYTRRVMGDAHQPWCAAFVTCMLKDQGINVVRGSAGVSDLMNQFSRAGRFFRPGSGQQPQPGDVIFFGNHHTGLVEKVENGKVYTVEGNSGDKVSERVYPVNGSGITYGRVFGNPVSSDLGFDTSDAGRGTSNASPGGRATGAGTANTPGDNGIEPSQYFNNDNKSFIALLRAMAGDDPKNVNAALQSMFPQVSNEDLAEVAQILKDHPELATKIAAHPELMQELVANHSEEGIQNALKTEMSQEDEAKAKRLLEQARPRGHSGGWAPPAKEAPVKAAPAQESPAKKTPAKEAPVKKAPPKQAPQPPSDATVQTASAGGWVPRGPEQA